MCVKLFFGTQSQKKTINFLLLKTCKHGGMVETTNILEFQFLNLESQVMDWILYVQQKEPLQNWFVYNKLMHLIMLHCKITCFTQAHKKTTNARHHVSLGGGGGDMFMLGVFIMGTPKEF